MKATFETVNFEGRWLACIGRPELRGAWFVWGGSGSGKTTFVLQLCKYLTKFGRVAYNSLEQGLSLSMQTAWGRVKMEEAGNNIILLNRETLAEIRKRLHKRNAPRVMVIDSLMCLTGFNRNVYSSLLAEFPNTLFIFICHEKNGKPDPAVGESVRRLADVKIFVEGYVAYPTTRYENEQTGEGGAEFVIWEKGANAFRAKVSANKQ